MGEVKTKFLIVTLFSCAALLLLSAYNAAAVTSLNGFAQLSYVNYKGKSDAGSFSGDTLAQTYSLSYRASNLFYRSQPRYYDLTVGYDWLRFDTETSEAARNTSISDVFGKLRYDGEVGYNPQDLPINFTAFAKDKNPLSIKRTLGDSSLVSDNLAYAIEGKTKNEMFGASFLFDPDRARTVALRGLPRLHLDYRETFTKSLGGIYLQDSKLKEIAVAGLGKGNNWLQFRSIVYEDNLDAHNNFDQKQFQIGLVDQQGRRLWSSLANWIEVSADGQLTNKRGLQGLEEYDINFMAIATRRTWEARTFMNYNRNTTTYSDLYSTRETVAKIPVYLKGNYGLDTTWYTRVSFERGEQAVSSSGLHSTQTSTSNNVSVGATTFTRSSFTLSPALSVTTANSYGGADTLSLNASLGTNSTARYSRTVGIAASTDFSYHDDGADSPTSKTWRQHATVSVNLRPSSRFSYSLKEDLEVGEAQSSDSQKAYVNNVRYFSARFNGLIVWTPSAALTSTLEAIHSLRTDEVSADQKELTLIHRISYGKNDTYYRLDHLYTATDNSTGRQWTFTSGGDVQYRPDRYNDAMLRYNYSAHNDSFSTSSSAELLQRYSYNFFTRAGVIRNLATIGQEFVYRSNTSFNQKRYTYSGAFNGRYAPTERLSLYGSARYETGDTGGVTLYYSGGLNADFKLLSTSLDYTLAKRDSDHRTEKRLNATVRRVF